MQPTSSVTFRVPDFVGNNDGVLLQAPTPVSTAHKSGVRHLRSRSRHDNDPNRAIAAGRKWRAADRRKRSRRHAH
jgi:hypothetical protein